MVLVGEREIFAILSVCFKETLQGKGVEMLTRISWQRSSAWKSHFARPLEDVLPGEVFAEGKNESRL